MNRNRDENVTARRNITSSIRNPFAASVELGSKTSA
jgi:hypothetical protein